MKKTTFILLILLAIQLFLLVNLEFTVWPEILSFPYLKNNGFLLYKDMVHAYPPLLTLLLSYYFKLVGFGVTQLKVFTWGGIILNNVLIFLSVKLLTKDEKKGLYASFFYALVQPLLEGNMLWFDTALTTPLLVSFYFLLLSIKDKFKNALFIFFSGLFMGVSLVTKQTALAFFFLSLAFLFWNKVGLKKIGLYCLGPAILLGLFFLRIYQEGAIEGFWNWTFYYPSTFWTKYPTYLDLSPAKRELAIVLLILSPALFIIFKGKKVGKELVSLLLFLFSGILAVYPRFSFYHFQPALAFASVLAGYMLFLNRRFLSKFLILLTALVFLLTLPASIRAWGKEDRFFGKEDIFLSQKIKEKEIEGRVYLLGLHSGLYVLSETLPPKPWIDNFGWYFEIPGVTETVLASWKDSPPDGVFWKKPEEGEWYELGTYQSQRVTEFIKENYTKEEDISPEVSFWRLK